MLSVSSVLRPESEPAPKSNQNAASGLPVKHSLTLKCSVNGSMFWIDMNSLSRSGSSDSGKVRGISDLICVRSAASWPPKPVSISQAASGCVSR